MSYNREVINMGYMYRHRIKEVVSGRKEAAYACNTNIPLSEPLSNDISKKIGTKATNLIFDPIITCVLLTGQTNRVENGLYDVHVDTRLLSRHPLMPIGCKACYVGVKCSDNWVYCCNTVDSEVGKSPLTWIQFSDHLTSQSDGRLEELSDLVQSMILPQLKELTRMVTDIYYGPNGPVAQAAKRKFEESSSEQASKRQRVKGGGLDEDEAE